MCRSVAKRLSRKIENFLKRNLHVSILNVNIRQKTILKSIESGCYFNKPFIESKIQPGFQLLLRGDIEAIRSFAALA
jgi:hypothetical protein